MILTPHKIGDPNILDYYNDKFLQIVIFVNSTTKPNVLIKNHDGHIIMIIVIMRF